MRASRAQIAPCAGHGCSWAGRNQVAVGTSFLALFGSQLKTGRLLHDLHWMKAQNEIWRGIEVVEGKDDEDSDSWNDSEELS